MGKPTRSIFGQSTEAASNLNPTATGLQKTTTLTQHLKIPTGNPNMGLLQNQINTTSE
jgi:hypothetical protein